MIIALWALLLAGLPQHICHIPQAHTQRCAEWTEATITVRLISKSLNQEGKLTVMIVGGFSMYALSSSVATSSTPTLKQSNSITK